MLTLLHQMQGLEALALAAARLWAAAGELLTAGAILWALDSLARSIRAAYAMGRTAGRILWPAIHALTAGGRWFAANVDWPTVAAVVIDCLKVLAVAAYVAAVMGRRFLISGSAALGRWYVARLVAVPTVPTVAVPPVAHPMANLAADLEALTCRDLMALTGCRRKIRKAELIALALAC
jgi:hypothetical protein